MSTVAQELMQYRESLSEPDPDIVLAIKLAAAIVEQIEHKSSGGPEPSITFDLWEYGRLPERWELDSGRLCFRCQRWADDNLRQYPEMGGYPPAPGPESDS